MQEKGDMGVMRNSKKNQKLFKVIRIAAIVLSTAVGILGIKSLVDSTIRSQHFLVRVCMNI